MPDRQTQTSFRAFSESLRSRRLSPVNPSAITGGRPIRMSGANIAKKEVEEFGQVRKILGGLLALEKRYHQFIGDRILHFAKEDERNRLRQEESEQERKKRLGKDKEKNPVLEKAKSDLSMIGQFFKNLLKFFVGYKVLEWASKKENVSKIQDFANLFKTIFKFISAVTGFGVDVLMKTLTVTSKVINGVFDFIGKVGEFFSFRWLGGGVEWLLSTIENATSVIASIPNAITLTVKFLTDLIPNFLESVLTQGLFGSQKELQGQADQAIETKKPAEPATPTTESDTGQKDLGDKAKESLSNIGKNILKTLFPGMDIAANIGAKIGGSVKSLFSGPKTQEPLPKLAKGGIVTKPTEAIVGEAGPEAILPLDKLGSFGIDGFKASTNKMIPKFMKLLTLPFNIIGAGIVALISSTVSKIPGIGKFILPLISNIASGFGLPAGLVAGMTNFVSGVTSAVSTGIGDISTLFGKNEVNIRQQKGEEFSPSNDTSVKGLLGNILGALISKQKKSVPASTDPPAPPAPPAPSLPAPSGGTPSTPPTPTSEPGTASPEKSQRGGIIGGQGTGDKIPALLEPGEYVLNRNAVQGMGGPKVLDHINYNKYARFQAGGAVPKGMKLLTSGGGTSALTAPVKFSQLKPHHGTGDSIRRYGITKDYILDGPSYPSYKVLTPVNATVAFAGNDPGGYGNMVELVDDNGKPLALFGHFSKLMVKTGQKISAGSILGIQGNTGRSTGAHVHIDASKKFHEAWSNFMLGKSTSLDATSLVSDSNLTGEDRVESEEKDTAPTFDPAKIAENLGKLFQMLNAPATTSVPEAATAPQTPKVTTAVSQTSGNLQRVQKENLKIQSQSRQQAKGGGNVITLGEPNKTITQANSQAITSALGDTTPPNSLITYPIAP